VANAALVIALASSLTAWSVAASAGPQDDKRKVTSELDAAHSDLDESSATLVKTSNALTAAQAKLTAAKTNLAKVRGQLATARADDATAAADLTAADAAHTAADAAVTAAQGDVDRQRSEIGQFANATYQNSNIDALSVVVGAQSTDDLLSAMQVISSVGDTQVSALANYTELRGRLAVKQESARAAADTASALRDKAATKLATTKALEKTAAAAETDIAGLVSARATAQRAAATARAVDLARISQLETERARIEKVLAAIAAREAAAARAHAADLASEAAAAAAANAADAEAKAEAADDAADEADGTGPTSSGALFRHAANGPITSPFGMRFHPILHVWKLHDGTDFGVACGTPVRAARAGTVESTYYNAGYGNRVIISHGWLAGASMATSYNHLTRWVVHPGERVKAGQLIAYSGTTGYSTGCHLHFMVYRNGTAVNPEHYL
jgi:murein DD-endopeptidase MepM/ murein hydrolase activator NlpD